MASQAFLEQAYLAYFGRPVDATGKTAFANSSEADVYKAFYASAESQALYGTTFGINQINAIYNMLFGRDAEPAGLTYWANQVATGAFAPAEAALKILNGALNADKTAVANKLAASALFTAGLDTTAEMLAYSGDAAAAAARNFLKTVTTTAATQAQVDAAIVTTSTATAAAAAVAATGQTFTLTGGADSLTPNSAAAASKTTSGDDLIRAVDAAGGTSELDTADYIDGGAGNDTLTASEFAVAAAPVVNSVETFNITHTGAVALNLASVTDLVTLNSVNATAAATFNNITLGTKLGVSDTTTANNVTFNFKAASVTGASDSADLNVSGLTTGATVTVDAIETINLTTSTKTGVTAANSVVLAGTTVENVNIAGDKAATIDIQGLNTTLVKVDASSATANLTVDLSAALTNDVTVKLGSGADTIDFTGSGAKKVSLETGAGNDTVAIAAGGKHVLDLGEGKDTLTVTAITGTQASVLDASTAAKLAASLVQVVNFTSGSDVLRVDTTSGAEINLTGTQLTAVADTTTNIDLKAAADAAHAAATTTKGGALAAGDVTVFQYGSDSYVMVENGGTVGTFDSADYLIKLVGVTSVAAADVVAI